MIPGMGTPMERIVIKGTVVRHANFNLGTESIIRHAGSADFPHSACEAFSIPVHTSLSDRLGSGISADEFIRRNTLAM